MNTLVKRIRTGKKLRGDKKRIEKKTIVLDSSAFIGGFDPLSGNEEKHSTPQVIEEINKTSSSGIRLKIAIECGKIKIKIPQKEFLDQVKSIASFSGDLHYLSKADIQVLALGLEFKTLGHKTIIVTDDYAIQNLAKHLNIEFKSILTLGIRHNLQWIRYCPGCYTKYESSYNDRRCEKCGLELKRKSVKAKKK